MTYTTTFDLDRIFREADRAVILLVEAISRRTVDKTLSPLQDALEKKLAAIFKRQGLAVLKKLGTMRSYFSESAASDFDDLFDSATLDTSTDMIDVLQASIEAAVLKGGKALINDFKASVNFSLTNPRAIAYTKNYAANAITGIDSTTKDDIRRIVLAGISDGASYSEVATNIKARYTQYAVGVPQRHIRSRAELIAVTEMGNAYQAGNMAGAQVMSDSGLKMQKYWLTSGDDKVSQGCQDNQADGWIDINTAHSSGDQNPLRFPGCRCVEQYRRKGSN
jgi:uncharacterized protein with gpF-like domain